jgi:hypothetical protein
MPNIDWNKTVLDPTNKDDVIYAICPYLNDQKECKRNCSKNLCYLLAEKVMNICQTGHITRRPTLVKALEDTPTLEKTLKLSAKEKGFREGRLAYLSCKSPVPPIGRAEYMQSYMKGWVSAALEHQKDIP